MANYVSRVDRGVKGGIRKAIPLTQDVYTLAKERIAIAADLHDKMIVSFSGRDSTNPDASII